MKIIVYGDPHGCLDEFIALRRQICIEKNDREIIIGDILDKGPKSYDLLQYVKDENIESIMGNHEYKYVRYYKHEMNYKTTNKKNPMQFEKQDLSLYLKLQDDDIEYLNKLPFYIKINNLTLIHAGILNNMNLEKSDLENLKKLLWIRYLKEDNIPLSLGKEDMNSIYWSEIYDGNQGCIIYGHNPFNEVKIDRYSIGIDTGCVYGNKLTACIISNTEDPMNNYKIIQQRRIRK